MKSKALQSLYKNKELKPRGQSTLQPYNWVREPRGQSTFKNQVPSKRKTQRSLPDQVTKLERSYNLRGVNWINLKSEKASL